MPLFKPHDQAGSMEEWVPENYQKIVSALRKANVIKDYRMGPSVVRSDAFSGEDLVGLIVKESGVKRHEALVLAEKIVREHFGQKSEKARASAFDTRKFYALQEDDASAPLNGLSLAQSPCSAECRESVADMNEELRPIAERIYEMVLSPNKRAVYFDRLDSSEDFTQYLSLVRRAAFVDLASATNDERLAFFINIYNLMLMHITHRYGPPATIWQRRKHFNSTYYTIGGHLYSLQTIQNGILRGNRKGVGMLWKPFGKEDLRRPVLRMYQLGITECSIQFMIHGGEPLAHFGINNCTRSSPPIRYYTTQNVYAELRENARKLLTTEEFLRVDAKKRIIAVSKIFKLYAEDFGTASDDIIEWIISLLMSGDACSALEKVYDDGDFSLQYISMDFSTNMIREAGS